MKRLLLPLLFPFLFLAGQGSTTTEYESLVATLPASFFVGGCDTAMNDSAEFEALYDSTIRRYSWSIVTADAADRMAAFIGEQGAVDFGAGSGYMSLVLAERGVDVLAFDDWSWGKPDHLWYPVEQGGLASIAGTADRVLLMSWPPRNGVALHALAAWGGSRLIYVGEMLRRTANYEFHEALANDWHLVERIEIPQWNNRSDAVFLFERRVGGGDGFGWIKNEIADCKETP
jgi:hypothetical protein